MVIKNWDFYRYTEQESSEKVYAIVLRYPESNKIDLYSIKEFVGDQTKVKLLGYDKEIQVRRFKKIGMRIR